MNPYWILIKKFWWLVPLSALLITTATFRVQRDNARDREAVLKADIAARDIEDVAAINESNRRANDADSKLGSATMAANILGADLSRRVRDYENRLRAGAVQSPGQPESAGRSDADPADAVQDLIASSLAACARDAARLDNAHDWASTLK